MASRGGAQVACSALRGHDAEITQPEANLQPVREKCGVRRGGEPLMHGNRRQKRQITPVSEWHTRPFCTALSRSRNITN